MLLSTDQLGRCAAEIAAAGGCVLIIESGARIFTDAEGLLGDLLREKGFEERTEMGAMAGVLCR